MMVALLCLLMLAVLCLQAFFSGSEIAMISASPVKLQSLEESGHVGAARARKLLASEDTLLGTCLIGTNLCLVSNSALAVRLGSELGVINPLWVTLLLTPVLLIFGEALPKTILQHHADRLAPVLSLPIRLFQLLFLPLLALVSGWNVLLSLFTPGERAQLKITRNDLVVLLEEGQQSPIPDEDIRIIVGVLSFSERTVEEVMTPLVRVEAFHANLSVAAARRAVQQSSHSRFPLFLRRIDHLLGFVHHSNLLFTEDDALPLRELMEPVRFVPGMKKAEALFREMRELGEQMAVVVDEYGGCVGIITREDLLEELVGEIEDEHDIQKVGVVRMEDGTLSIPGRTEWDILPDEIDLADYADEVETVAGVILSVLQRLPVQGETCAVGPHRFRIEECTDRSITRVRWLHKVEAEPEESATSVVDS